MFDTYFIKHNKYLNDIQEDIDDAEKVLSKSGNINLKSFDLHDELNDKIWDKKSNLKSNIRKQLLQIAHDFYDTLDISEITETDNSDKKPDKTFDIYVKDVLFVGSLASFNYSSYADVDLHLLMDENKLVDNNELALNILKKYFTECKNDWNLKHSDLNIEGYDCELYVQDVKEKNASNGVYSLLNNKWIKFPKQLKANEFDKEWVKKKALSYIEQIDKLEKSIDDNTSIEELENIRTKLQDIKDKIIKGRRDSLAAGQGEMNNYNILFKVLRRTEHIGKINDLLNKSYDLINSLKENNMKLDEKKNFKITEAKCKKVKKEFAESKDIDAIAEFADMYGEEAADALKKYLIKRRDLTALDILESDLAFEKFSNWAFKKLGIDVYEKFSKYDTGTFYKRTYDPEKALERPIKIRMYGREADIMTPAEPLPGSAFESKKANKINEGFKIYQTGSATDFEDRTRDCEYFWERIHDNNLEDRLNAYFEEEYPDGLDLNQFNDIIRFSGDDILEDIGFEISEEEIEDSEKTDNEKEENLVTEDSRERLIIGSIGDKNVTVMMVTDDPKNIEGLDDVLVSLDSNDEKWTKDPEYSYWYVAIPKSLEDVQNILKSKNFDQKFDIQLNENCK